MKDFPQSFVASSDETPRQHVSGVFEGKLTTAKPTNCDPKYLMPEPFALNKNRGVKKKPSFVSLARRKHLRELLRLSSLPKDIGTSSTSQCVDLKHLPSKKRRFKSAFSSYEEISIASEGFTKKHVVYTHNKVESSNFIDRRNVTRGLEGLKNVIVNISATLPRTVSISRETVHNGCTKINDPGTSCVTSPMMLASPSGAVSVFLQSDRCHKLLWKYAHDEYSAENIHFWHHIIEYRNLLDEASDPSLIRTHEDFMIDMYIHENSKHALNLSDKLLKHIRSHPHSTESWLEIQGEVAQLIRNGPYMRLALNISSKLSRSWNLFLNRVSISEAGEIFYENLFVKVPSLRNLFPTEISSQAEMLIQMINSCISFLTNIEKLVDLVIGLGMRHRQYGVLPEHFKATGEALMEMLHSVLKTDFDHETQHAWITVYELLSSLMIMSLDSTQSNQFIVEESAIFEENKKPLTEMMEQEKIAIEIEETNQFTNYTNNVGQYKCRWLGLILLGVVIGVFVGFWFIYA